MRHNLFFFSAEIKYPVDQFYFFLVPSITNCFFFLLILQVNRKGQKHFNHFFNNFLYLDFYHLKTRTFYRRWFRHSHLFHKFSEFSTLDFSLFWRIYDFFCLLHCEIPLNMRILIAAVPISNWKQKVPRSFMIGFNFRDRLQFRLWFYQVFRWIGINWTVEDL